MVPTSPWCISPSEAGQDPCNFGLLCRVKKRSSQQASSSSPGPHKLVGVLARFRGELVAFMADIESMFLQVHVTEHCRDLLRFLW